MKSRRFAMWICIMLVAVNFAKGSVLTKKSLLTPTKQTCFTCNAEDKPFAWPKVAQLVRIKDALLHAVNSLTDKISKYKLT